MHTASVVSAILAGALSVVPAVARAQCSPATQQLLNDRRFDEAKAEVQTLLKQNEKDDVALHCMGRILVDQDRSNDAIEWFEKAVAANDKVAAHHLWLANAIGDQAQHASKFKQPFLARRIKSEFEKAAQLDPTSIDARHGLIQFYSIAPGIMGGSMDKAKEQAREIETLSPWRGHSEMGRLLEHDKDLAGAEKEFAASVAAAPDSSGGALALASFYRRQKRWSEAVEAYDNLLKRRPDLVNVHLTLAYTLYQSGTDLDRAERETRIWLAAPPSDAPKNNTSIAHFLLGQFAERQGKKEVAKSEYEQALALFPENGDAKKALASLK